MEEDKKAAVARLINKAKRLKGRIGFRYAAGKLEETLDLIKQGEEIIRKFQGELPEELVELHLFALRFKTTISAYRGDIILNFTQINEFLTIAEKYGDMWGLSEAMYAFGRYYWLNNDSEKAFEFLDRALKYKAALINDHSPPMTADIAATASQIAIEKGDLERARKYFKYVEEIYNQRTEKDGLLTHAYKLAEANILKSSMRARDRIKAEELFKEVMESGIVADIYKFKALFGLSELLLVELRLTNDIEIINELTPLINKLIDVAHIRKYHYYLIEAFILQGKLSLLTFDIKTARRFLTQAQRIAQRHGYIGVASEISNLQGELMQRLTTWEHLKETNADLSERIELARLEDHLKGKFRTKLMKMERTAVKEITIFKDIKTCLVCKGEVEGFNVYICPDCNSIYCKGCAESLVDIENQCWSCSSTINKSMPVRSLTLTEEKSSYKNEIK